MGEHYLFIMHSFGGGAEVVTLTLARQLQNKGDVVRVVCTKYIPELERAVPPCLPFIMPAGPSFWQCLRLFPAIRKAAKESPGRSGQSGAAKHLLGRAVRQRQGHRLAAQRFGRILRSKDRLVRAIICRHSGLGLCSLRFYHLCKPGGA